MIRIACHVQDYYFEIIKKYFVAKDYYLKNSIQHLMMISILLK